METIKVLQAEESDTSWAVSKLVISKGTEILLPVPFLQELPMAQDAGSHAAASSRIVPNVDFCRWNMPNWVVLKTN